MGFTDVREELLNIAYDPNQVQVTTLNYLQNLLDGVDIPDPTNSFMFQIESNANIGSVLLEKMKTNIRKLYPTLATNKDDLFHHVYDREIENLFAYPSNATFNIFIATSQIKTYGENMGSYYQMTIPMFTKLTVKNYYNYTFLNDIVIKYYENNRTSLVIEMPNDLSISNVGDAIIDSSIITDNSGVDWLLMTVTLKQTNINFFSEPVMSSMGFSNTYTLPNQFYTLYGYGYSDTYGKLDLVPTFSDFVYDVKSPILKCKLKDTNIIDMLLYDTFLLNSDINKVQLLMFDTLGKIETSFLNYKASDFVLDFSVIADMNGTVGPIQNITPVISSSSFIKGGRDMLSFDELKKIIVNATTGDNKIPITNYDIAEKVERYGFTLNDTLDSVLKREFVVSKKLSVDTEDTFIYANPDLTISTLAVDENNNGSSLLTIEDGKGILEPYAFFKDEGGYISILSDVERDKIRNLTGNDLKNYLTDNKYFYNIYKYIFDYKDRLSYRIYDVNRPSVDYIKALYQNTDLPFSVIYNSNNLVKVGSTYTLTISLDFKNITDDDLSKLGLVFKFKPYDSLSYIYLPGKLDENNNAVFEFNLNPYIQADDTAELSGYYSVMDYVRVCGNISGEIYIYTTDKTKENFNNTYLQNIESINDYIPDIATNVLTMFETDVRLFYPIKYLHSNYRVTPNSRYYETYTEDVYATYDKDVLEYDEDGNLVLEPVDLDGDGVADTEIPKVLYKAGDLILDDDGNPIIQHKAGDVILDENGKPIINYDTGFVHYLDISMFELEFLLTTKLEYKRFMIDKYLEFSSIIIDELGALNDELLEDTKILFKPAYTTMPVKVYVNDGIYNLDYRIRPVVNIYVIDLITDPNVLETLKRKIGILLQDGITRFSNRIDINNLIQTTLQDDNIQYVRVTEIDKEQDLEVYNYTDDSNRFIIDKKLDFNLLGEQVPQLDYELKITKV